MAFAGHYHFCVILCVVVVVVVDDDDDDVDVVVLLLFLIFLACSAEWGEVHHRRGTDQLSELWDRCTKACSLVPRPLPLGTGL